VSHNAAGTGGGNGPSTAPAFSPDGSQIAFRSSAANLVAGVSDTNKADDVFVHDLGTGAMTGVTVTPAGTTGDGAAAPFTPRWSPDGTRLLFTTAAGDLGPVDTNGFEDLYSVEPATQVVMMVTGKSAGVDGADGANAPTGPGTFRPSEPWIAFAHPGTDLLSGVDTNEASNIYLTVTR
jgi:dipeptidyl aminopeptidase/acylaminoacyl peptidase